MKTYQFNGSLEDCLDKLTTVIFDGMLGGRFETSHEISAAIEAFLRANGREQGPEDAKGKLVEYTTADHPEANGRKPLAGEVGYSPTFPLQNGDTLRVKIGQQSFDTFAQFILDMLADRPSYGDGTVDFDRPPDFKP